MSKAPTTRMANAAIQNAITARPSHMLRSVRRLAR